MWTFMTMSQSAMSMFLKLLSRRIPALFTRMSTVPNAATASSMIDWAPSLSETDALLAISFSTESADFLDRRVNHVALALAVTGSTEVVQDNFCPTLGKLDCVRLSSPPPAPVITTTLSLKSP